MWGFQVLNVFTMLNRVDLLLTEFMFNWKGLQTFFTQVNKLVDTNNKIDNLMIPKTKQFFWVYIYIYIYLYYIL